MTTGPTNDDLVDALTRRLRAVIDASGPTPAEEQIEAVRRMLDPSRPLPPAPRPVRSGSDKRS